MKNKVAQDQWQTKLYDRSFASKTIGSKPMKAIAKHKIESVGVDISPACIS